MPIVNSMAVDAVDIIQHLPPARLYAIADHRATTP
jgi:hypothetical protein